MNARIGAAAVAGDQCCHSRSMAIGVDLAASRSSYALVASTEEITLQVWMGVGAGIDYGDHNARASRYASSLWDFETA